MRFLNVCWVGAWLAMQVLAGWKTRLRFLFGEYQFSLAGYSKLILHGVVVDENFSIAAEQLLTDNHIIDDMSCAKVGRWPFHLDVGLICRDLIHLRAMLMRLIIICNRK